MHIKRILVGLSLIASLVLGACASTTQTPLSTSQPQSNPLENTNWLLTALNDQPVMPETQVTINFTDHLVSGTDGCNRYNSSYTADDLHLAIDKNIASTMMACAEPVMRQASAFTSALSQAAVFKLSSGTLTLFDAHQKTLAVFTVQSQALAGTSWIVTGYNNGRQAVISVLAGAPLTLNFVADGRLHGSAGCNTYSGSFQTSGADLTLSALASTMMACSDPVGIMDQESQFLHALQSAVSYHIDGDQLELRDRSAALAVSLVRANAVPSPTDSPQVSATQQGNSLPDAFITAMRNSPFPIEGATNGMASLMNGSFEEESAPGSSMKFKVQLGNILAVGDLNNDGQSDAAVNLVVESGGSGTFTYLAVVLNQNNTPKPAASTFLGDRIQLDSIEINSGTLIVNYLDRAPDQPMSAKPVVKVTRSFAYQDGRLVEIK